ncbi:MAG: hypothetical protein ILA25_08545 [Prevotella sp.]|nr:hypothetical protein [Prevotella sp.]
MMKNKNIQYRSDLSEWVIHFVHNRKPEDNFDDLQEIAELEGYDDDVRLPDYYDAEGKGHNVLSGYDEKYYDIASDAPAFEVLLKILHDGFIHSSWSVRNMAPAIYGPKTAVCFTEMPLYALIQYAKFRGAYSGYVGNYGIAFKRNELFAAGGRPVIYGLSGAHIEAEKTPKGIYQGRILDVEKTGISIHEQYRYVATKLQKRYAYVEYPIDWTHEREWRWALPDGDFGVPGIPFFLSKNYADFFSEIIVIVGTDEEQIETIMHLKNLYDAGSTGLGHEYDVNKIAATRVVSLETIAKMQNIDMQHIRIEDLPTRQMAVMPTFKVASELEEKVKNAVVAAGKVSIDAVAEFLKQNPDFDEQKGFWGWAYVCTNDQTETTQALQNSGLSHTYADGIYRLSIKEYRTSNLDLLTIGAEAAAAFLERELGQQFYVTTKLD